MIYSGTGISNFNTSHLHVKVFYSGSVGGWSGWSSNTSGFPSQTIVDWRAEPNVATTGFNHNYSSSLTVQLVKRGSGTIPNLPAGSQISFNLSARARTFMALHADYWLDGKQGWRNDALWWSPDKPAIFTFNLASVVPPPPPTCTTPNIPAQTLPTVDVADFNFSSGALMWANKIFDLKFVNCSNQSQIRYMANAVGTSPNPSQGLLPASPNLGVSFQVWHFPSGATGYVLPLGQWQTIYTNASSYTVQMLITYYRNGGPISPGNISSAMTITTQYQ